MWRSALTGVMTTVLPAMLALAGLSNPAGGQALMGDRDAGYALAKTACVRCHRIGREEETPKLYPATAFQEIANRPSSTELSLRVFLKLPHQDMPNLILTDTEIDNVVAYILGLK